MKDISIETFETCDIKGQRRILFEGIKGIHTILDKQDTDKIQQVKECDKRFNKIETSQTKWKIAFGSVLAGSGVVGWTIGAFDKIKSWFN